MIDPAQIEILKKRPEWRALAEHIEEHITKLDRVSDITLTNHDDIATEAIGRNRALHILAEILEPFGFAVGSTPDNKTHTAGKTGLL